MADIRYNNSFSLAGGFNITNAEPIDSRMYVNDISHILLDENWVKVKPYPGLIVADPNGEVRICVNSDYTQESSWKKIGGGSVAVNSLEEANILATSDNIGQVIYVKGESAAYIVAGENVLSKLATAVSGNIDDIVTSLQNDVNALKAINFDAFKDADNALKTELLNEISFKVDVEDGKSLVADEEIAKLATVAEGAEVNIINSIKFNGVEVTPDEDKTVNIVFDVPQANVSDVDANDNFLKLDNGILSSSILFGRESVEGEDSLVLKGKDGEVISSVSVADFVMDGILKDISFSKDAETGEDTNILNFTFTTYETNTETGEKTLIEKTLPVDLSKYIDVYEAGEGIDISNGIISVENPFTTEDKEKLDSTASAIANFENVFATQEYVDNTFVKSEGYNPFTPEYKAVLDDLENTYAKIDYINNTYAKVEDVEKTYLKMDAVATIEEIDNIIVNKQ